MHKHDDSEIWVTITTEEIKPGETWVINPTPAFIEELDPRDVIWRSEYGAITEVMIRQKDAQGESAPR